MINYIIGFVFLFLQSLNDLKTYEIDPKLCYIFAFLGILYHISLFLISNNVNYLIFPFFTFVLTFLFLYFLWYLGFIGGGDLKVISTISFISPCFNYDNLFFILNIIPLDLFFLSIILSLPYTIIYTLSLKPITFWFKRLLDLRFEIKIISILLLIFLIDHLLNYYNFFINLILIFLLLKIISENISKILFPLLLLLNVFLFFNEFIYYFISLTLFLIFLLYLKNFISVLEIDKHLNNIKEGDILNNDYLLINGKVKKTNPYLRYLYIFKYNANPLVLSKASGITKEEIEILKKYGINKVEIKYKIPFIPSLLFSYIVLIGLSSMIDFNNVIWF